MPLASLFIFFFQCSRDHRDLHSFPTRRSSDLVPTRMMTGRWRPAKLVAVTAAGLHGHERSEEHTSELQSRPHLVCRLLLEKKKIDEDNARVEDVHGIGLL